MKPKLLPQQTPTRPPRLMRTLQLLMVLLLPPLVRRARRPRLKPVSYHITRPYSAFTDLFKPPHKHRVRTWVDRKSSIGFVIIILLCCTAH